jgi:hypothetical protein
MSTFRLPGIPAELRWNLPPAEWAVDPDGSLAIAAGARTDWFVDPSGRRPDDTAPAALFVPPEPAFLLSARVEVGFASTFDAGVLQLRCGPDLWAKLCFEFSPQREPMIVSVVTRGVSDDCNSTVIEGRAVWLRIAHTPRTTALHYSRDGRCWHLVRYFTLGSTATPAVGFSAQSPHGLGCRAVFSEIGYRVGALQDIRGGD